MEIQICFGDNPENDEIQKPTTIEELGKLLEGKVNNIEIDGGDDWCVLAVDHNQTGRNTDKEGGGYIKFYPHCKTLSGDMSKQKVFRIYTDLKDGKAIYTVHNGKGKGSGTITKDECEMFVAACAAIVDVKERGRETVFKMLDHDIKTKEDSEYTIPPNKKGKQQKILRVSTKDIEKRVAGTELEPFLNIEYDGKRKL